MLVCVHWMSKRRIYDAFYVISFLACVIFLFMVKSVLTIQSYRPFWPSRFLHYYSSQLFAFWQPELVPEQHQCFTGKTKNHLCQGLGLRGLWTQTKWTRAHRLWLSQTHTITSIPKQITSLVQTLWWNKTFPIPKHRIFLNISSFFKAIRFAPATISQPSWGWIL